MPPRTTGADRELFLVDATYELFRSFHALPTLEAPDGREVGGVYGLVNTLIALLRDREVRFVACATDDGVESWRNELFPPYKEGVEVPDALRAQLEPADRALRALGMTVWRMRDFEADDAIATAADRFAGDFDRTLVASADKDFAQLVRGDRVVLLDRRGDRLLDEDAVRERWGVAPASIPDYLALAGDASDAIPGLEDWGPRSTSAVSARYGRLEDIPDDPGDWNVDVRGAERLAATLREHRGEAGLYKRLTTLRTDAPIDDEAPAWTGIDEDALRALSDELGLERLLERALELPRPDHQSTDRACGPRVSEGNTRGSARRAAPVPRPEGAAKQRGAGPPGQESRRQPECQKAWRSGRGRPRRRRSPVAQREHGRSVLYSCPMTSRTSPLIFPSTART
ncbi:MAG: 5'-3' exonuclease [Myxococcota bacterium]